MNRQAAIALSAALLLCSSAAFAADPPAGLRATGTLVVQTRFQGSPINVGGNVAFYRKANLFRLDLLSLGIPGTSGDVGALATALIGPGGMSAVYDTATGTLTAWSNSHRTYYTAAPQRRAAAPAPSSSGAVAAADPLAALTNLASALHDVQSATIQLVGHNPVNGHPATNLDLQMRRQLPGKPLENYHAQLALADDLGEFPLQIAVQSTPATPSAIGGTAKLDLTSVQPDNPDDSMFRPPAGYTRVNSIGAVFGGAIPGQ